MTVEFMGYRRANGCVGIRNVVAILSAMDNTNPSAARIGAMVAPTIKVTGNPNTACGMGENIDVDVSAILNHGEDLDTAGTRVWDKVLKVASGMLTSCEVLGEEQLSVSRFGPSV